MHYRILTPTNSILVFRHQATVQSFIKFYSRCDRRSDDRQTQTNRQTDASDLCHAMQQQWDRKNVKQYNSLGVIEANVILV